MGRTFFFFAKKALADEIYSASLAYSLHTFAHHHLCMATAKLSWELHSQYGNTPPLVHTAMSIIGNKMLVFGGYVAPGLRETNRMRIINLGEYFYKALRMKELNFSILITFPFDTCIRLKNSDHGQAPYRR